MCVLSHVRLRLHGLQPPGSSVHGIFQARILPFSPPGDLPDPSDQTHISSVSCIVRWIFTTEPLRKFRYLEWIWIWMCTYLPRASKQERWIQSLGQEYPLEKGMATHSSITCLENSMDRGVWMAPVYEATKVRYDWMRTHTHKQW